MLELKVIGIIVGVVVLIVVGSLLILVNFYKKVDQGKALIVNTMKDKPFVTFTGATVYPIINRAEVMDISLKKIEIDRRGKEGLICKDNIRADIKVTFFVRVNKTEEDVLKVAQSIGCQRASDHQTIEELFREKFSEALKTVGKALEFVELYQKRAEFRSQIIDVIGEDLNGYVLDDVAIDYLEQTPLENLDKDNILDAEGIRKIVQLTTTQNVATNEFKQSERKAITKQNVEADEAVLELERRRAETEEKKKREIATVQAREEAEIALVRSEERARSEGARIKSEEEIAVQEENKERQIEVAQKARQRVVGVEAERVEKDRALEAIAREREVELQRISKEKALEEKRKEIAEVIRERIAVEKTVAEEEERIKDLRANSGAKRDKDVKIIAAEASAEEKLVTNIKDAEAREKVAEHEARERLTRATATVEAAGKEAEAKKRAAEGTKAETSAEGMGQVMVQEAEAAAIEKRGRAEAAVTLEKMQAVAKGEESQGLAKIRVQEAEADAIEKRGLAEVRIKQAEADAIEKTGAAEAAAVRDRMLAEATGREAEAAAIQKRGEAEAIATREKLLAEAAGKEADAAAIQKRGEAEAVAVKEKLLAEAAGLAQKAEAMKALDGVGREHEEYRLRLEHNREIQLAAIHVKSDVAKAQAAILSEAFAQSKINIVGGDGAFFERFINAVTLGQTVDGFVENSDTSKALFGKYLEGEGDIVSDLKEVLTRPALGADAVQKLSLSALLGKLASEVDESKRAKIEALVDKAKELGIDEIG